MYNSDKIRNVCVLGHLGSGKTTLVEACYSVANGIKASAKATVERKNTISDFMVEEQQRLSSISNAIVPVFHQDYKINFIDVPGNDDFIGEVVAATNVVKGAIVVLDAASGIEVGTVKHWNMLRRRNIPTFLFINKLDKENVNLTKLLAELREKFGKTVVPFEYPIINNGHFDGYIDIVEMIGRKFNGEEVVDFELKDSDITPEVEELRTNIMEAVAETSEELMEKYFGGETITPEEIKGALRQAVLGSETFPVLLGCANISIGVKSLLSMLESFLPAPNDLNPIVAKTEDDKEVVLKTKNDEPFAALVFKTMVDQYSGVTNIFKIYSGTIKVGDDIYCPQTGKTEKVAQLTIPCGKKQIEVNELAAGDIGSISKLTGVVTNMTICSPKTPLIFDKIPFPTAVLYRAFKAKNKADEDKIGQALNRIMAEDPTIFVTRNAEVRQQLLGGQGTGHVNYVFDRLKNAYKIDVETEAPKIVYRETIKGSVETEGRYKKQSGGSGHFGVVKIKWEKSGSDENIFAEQVFGGAVPKNFFPAVEKGVNKSLESGLLAGFPVIGVKATLLDGAYHPVDSDEISFVNAAILSYKEAYEVNKDGRTGNKFLLKPTILEPIMKLTITASSIYTGDILSDINTRRARVLSMEETNGEQVLVAAVPEAEILEYANTLKSITKSSGMFTREFMAYEEVPSFLIDKVIADNRITREDKQ